MKYIFSLSACAAVCIAGTASADVTGVYTTRYTDISEDRGQSTQTTTVIDVYVSSDDDADTVLGIFDFSLNPEAQVIYFQSASEPAFPTNTWWLPKNPGGIFDLQSVRRSDSFVTIGGGVGADAATNVTTPDPNLGTATNPDIFNENVGWFLNPPTSSQGDVVDFKVWVGRFVVTGAEARGGANFDMSGTVGYNYGESTGAYFGDGGGNFTFNIPAPGALALLGLGGFATRRRRG